MSTLHYKWVIECIHLVIQVSTVKRVKAGKDLVPMKRVKLQQVSCKDICMVHGQVETGKKKSK